MMTDDEGQDRRPWDLAEVTDRLLHWAWEANPQDASPDRRRLYVGRMRGRPMVYVALHHVRTGFVEDATQPLPPATDDTLAIGREGVAALAVGAAPPVADLMLILLHSDRRCLPCHPEDRTRCPFCGGTGRDVVSHLADIVGHHVSDVLIEHDLRERYGGDHRVH